MQFHKIFLIIVFIICCSHVFGQNVKVRQAKIAAKHTYNELENAKNNIDEAIKNEKTMHKPKTWLVRGDVYFKIATSDKSEIRKLAENPIDDAYYAYKKAFRFDLKRKYTKDIYSQLKLIKDLYHNEGIEMFNAKNYKRSFVCFENVLNIGKFLNKGQIDTIMLYNLGLVSELNSNTSDAINYYKQCIELKYGGPKVYNYVAQILKKQGDTTQYIQYLKNGIEVYPQRNDTLLLELINHYIDNNNNYLAIEFLSQAIAKDPFNATFYFAKGALYGKLDDYKNAVTAYENALVIDSTYFDAYFNLGALYFNKGAKLLKVANNIPPSKESEYEQKLDEAYKEFKNAIPYLEKALKFRHNDLATVTILKDIFLKLRNEDFKYKEKFNFYNKKLNNLSEG